MSPPSAGAGTKSKDDIGHEVDNFEANGNPYKQFQGGRSAQMKGTDGVRKGPNDEPTLNSDRHPDPHTRGTGSSIAGSGFVKRQVRKNLPKSCYMDINFLIQSTVAADTDISGDSDYKLGIFHLAIGSNWVLKVEIKIYIYVLWIINLFLTYFLHSTFLFLPL